MIVQLDFLRWIASWRTPLLDAFFGTITYLGDELGLIALGLLFFWCIDKKNAYYLLFVGFTGTVFNQILKLCFRIERPWVLDPSLRPVESAIEGAGGYSFPSGHTQASVGLFGAIGRIFNTRRVWLLCLVPLILVPFSRMYLGVHTPMDVGVSAVLALALVFAFHPLVEWAWGNGRRMALLLGALTGLSFLFLLFVLLVTPALGVSDAHYASGLKNACTILGAMLGLCLAYFVDTKYIRFETAAPLPVQVVKAVVGAALVFGVKALSKKPLVLLLGEGFESLGRYFLLVVVAAVLWPLAFRPLTRLYGRLFPTKTDG